MARFDWYQATDHDRGVEEITAALLAAADLADIRPSRPMNGYAYGAEIVRGDHVLATVWWGGNPGVHVKGTGEDAPFVSDVLRSLGAHAVTRVDACEDWIEPGLFDRLSSRLISFALENSISLNQQGDWQRGRARTLYLGSASSAVRLVLYEKGYETGGDLNWVRLEARVRPASRAAKVMVSAWAPGQCFTAAPWLVRALECIGWDRLEGQGVTKPWRPSDAERARRALLKQYKRVLAQWAGEVGSWERLGLVLRDEVEGVRDGAVA